MPVPGTTMKYPRWTQATTGEVPVMKLLQQGSMPKTSKRHGARKQVK